MMIGKVINKALKNLKSYKKILLMKQLKKMKN